MKNLLMTTLLITMAAGAAQAEIFALWKTETTANYCSYSGDAYFHKLTIDKTIKKKDGKCPVYLKYNTQTKSLLPY